MPKFDGIYFSPTGFTHHAYLIEAAGKFFVDELCPFFESIGISTHGNPDLWYGEHETFGINEARTIKEFSSRMPAETGGQKIIVVTTTAITLEAQNALLKTFEEPPVKTHFFLITPSAAFLLPTLLSRIALITQKKWEGQTPIEKAQEFLDVSYAKRMELVTKIAKAKEGGGDKRGAIELFEGLIEILHARGVENLSKREATALEEISRAREYLYGRSPAVKMIMENIALLA